MHSRRTSLVDSLKAAHPQRQLQDDRTELRSPRWQSRIDSRTAYYVYRLKYGILHYRTLILCFMTGAAIFALVVIAVAQDGPTAAFESTSIDAYHRCNPFKERGYIRNDENIEKVLYMPFDKSCPASNLFTHEFIQYKTLPWFGNHNRTIVLIGDSIERFHVTDLCEFLGIESERISLDHPASPPIYHTPGTRNATLRQKEQALGEKKTPKTRPHLCRIEVCASAEGCGKQEQKLFLNIINFFTFGASDVGELFDEKPTYHPPSGYSARLHHWIIPTLTNLARYYQDTSFSSPSLVEFQDGYWSLHGWSVADLQAAGQTQPKKGDISTFSSVFTDLNRERLDSHAIALRSVILDVVRTFDEAAAAAGAKAPAFLWRTAPFTAEPNWWVPWPRMAQLDNLVRHTIEQLWKESRQSTRSDAGRLQLHRKLRLNDFGRLIEGQRNRWRDASHPAANPSSIIWIQTILWELRRAIEMEGFGK